MKSSSMKYGYRYCPRQCHHHISFADPVILEKTYSVRLFTPKMNSLLWKSNLTGAFASSHGVVPLYSQLVFNICSACLHVYFEVNPAEFSDPYYWISWIQDCSHPRWVSFHLPCFIFGNIMVLNSLSLFLWWPSVLVGTFDSGHKCKISSAAAMI